MGKLFFDFLDLIKQALVVMLKRTLKYTSSPIFKTIAVIIKLNSRPTKI